MSNKSTLNLFLITLAFVIANSPTMATQYTTQYTTTYIQPNANITLLRTPDDSLTVAFSTTESITYKLLLFNVEQDTKTSTEFSHTYYDLERAQYKIAFINNNNDIVAISYRIDNYKYNTDGALIIFVSITFIFFCCLLFYFKLKCDPDCRRRITSRSHTITRVRFYQSV